MKKTYIKDILLNPCDKNVHFEYSKYLSENNSDFLAYAEYKTSLYFGKEKNFMYEKELKENLPDLLELDYNQYFRLKTLSNKLNTLKNNTTNTSILDIGGGYGQLASFLDDNYDYCLVEPKNNGLDGRDLPFEENSFDYVVSSHVLEHIPLEDRNKFLNTMLRISKKGIILINPFEIEGTFEKERLKLAYEIINKQWIKEHIDCGLPKIEDIKNFAKENNKNIEILPSGSLLTSMTYMYLEHYSNLAKKRKEYKKINKFYNKNYFDISINADYPVEYLVCIN